MWREVGIDVTMEVVDCGTYFTRMRDKVLHDTVVNNPPYSMGPPALRSVLIYRSGPEGYLDGYTSPGNDALYGELDFEVVPEERQRLLERDRRRAVL